MAKTVVEIFQHIDMTANQLDSILKLIGDPKEKTTVDQMGARSKRNEADKRLEKEKEGKSLFVTYEQRPDGCILPANWIGKKERWHDDDLPTPDMTLTNNTISNVLNNY
ncbi:UNVERIFIED_CONTAM: hypothetical protein K2H54_032957 [Gekko kuhli]